MAKSFAQNRKKTKEEMRENYSSTWAYGTEIASHLQQILTRGGLSPAERTAVSDAIEILKTAPLIHDRTIRYLSGEQVALGQTIRRLIKA